MGADFKQRIIRLMTERASLKPYFSKKLLFSVVGLLGVVLPILSAGAIWAQSQNPATAQLKFETFSVMPDKPASEGGLQPIPSNFTERTASRQSLLPVHYDVSEGNHAHNSRGWLNPWAVECAAERLLPYLYLLLPLFVLVIVVHAAKESQ